MDAAMLIERLRSRGVRLWVEGTALKFQPASMLTADDWETLRERKPEIIALLSERGPAPVLCAMCQAAADATSAIERAATRRARLRSVVLELARALGFPEVEIRPGHHTAGGEFLWLKYTATAPLTDLQDLILPQLRRRLNELTDSFKEAA